MKVFNKFLFVSLLGCTSLLTIQGCKENDLVFPTQIKGEDDGDSDQEVGPVKQNTFSVIIDDDEKVKFIMGEIDKERIQSIFFSHNGNGEKVVTELTDFASQYVIANLPTDQVSDVEVWAKGVNGLESKKFTYKVKPLVYPSRAVAQTLKVLGGFRSGAIDVANITRADATLFYKVDGAATFTSVALPAPTTDMEIVIENLARGSHTLTYYLTDVNGGQTSEMTKSFEVFEVFAINKSELNVNVSSVETQEGAANGKGSSMIDGSITTFWHSTWSSSSNPEYPHWFIVDLGKERLFTELDMIRRHNNTTGGFKTFNVDYSLDNVTWTRLATGETFNSADNPAAWQKFKFQPTNARYVRIYITAPFGSSTSTHLAEINVYEAKY
ncbi:F5/8 type C domain-containing protein [Sphingobacterium nematocida]|uniref:F5/8 type C domain-containing protein n=1 Tax=Sphingobacterium nematocida TaxID=1513896 RepID=A0A1T5GH19_9SPHI|nr:discoidin domain-containing protein [Sphingobacterium nematocida]SKC07666.1 F5/8 type C domain-containing protein [Sphingobacterium nematocida]